MLLASASECVVVLMQRSCELGFGMAREGKQGGKPACICRGGAKVGREMVIGRPHLE